jgi:hypothetical protein
MKALQLVESGARNRGGAPAPSSDAIRAFFAAVVREAVREELVEIGGSSAERRGPALVDRNGLAQALSVSVSTIDRLRAEGAPTVWVADAPRFEPEAVVAWLRSRGAPE